ncbi:MAG TPA: BatA domain-containing protein [candidate division Zixibacteria bacterium]|nr:BatA domain-containing protein [candidate division Zixibacteria bacterium]
MEFLNPGALLGFLALPLLLVPYLVRRKPQSFVFSSLLLFEEIDPRSRPRPWGRLRLPPIFFLQLLLLVLLILALGEPVSTARPSKVALVFDNSASMQALEGSRTRFALAQEKARELLSAAGAPAAVDLYLWLPRLERWNERSLTAAEARREIGRLQPYDLPDLPVDHTETFDRLAREHGYDRIYFFTDHPSRSQSGITRVVSVGEPKPNLAVTSFRLARASLGSPSLEATVELTNLSGREARVSLAIKSGSSTLASRELRVEAGRAAQVGFEGLPHRPYYQAEIVTSDALPLDNSRFAVPPRGKAMRVLAVSPRPQALASLRSIPGLELEIVPPERYLQTPRSDFAVEIFHFATPAGLPDNPALFVLPPEHNPLASLGQPLGRVVVSTWRDPHPLTRYVNFALFRPPYARHVRPRMPAVAVIESPEGPLAVAAEARTLRYLVLGFDPFPYLGRDNLPVSIFTLNFLDWLAGSSGSPQVTTGEGLVFTPVEQGDRLVLPAGGEIALARGSSRFQGTFYQGIYRLQRGHQAELTPVNFDSVTESDLRTAQPIAVGQQTGGGTNPSVLRSLWPYLAFFSFVLLIVEWFVSPAGGGTYPPVSGSRPSLRRIFGSA